MRSNGNPVNITAFDVELKGQIVAGNWGSGRVKVRVKVTFRALSS